MPAPAGRWGSPDYLARPSKIQRQQKEDELKEGQYAYKIGSQNELDHIGTNLASSREQLRTIATTSSESS